MTSKNKENEQSAGDCSVLIDSLCGEQKSGRGPERQEAVNLARWMEEKLGGFRNKKRVTFMDILDYKQTVLNYALGRIIDSLTKKCR